MSTLETTVSMLQLLFDTVFCKYFFQKVASNFWRMLHLQIGESCKRCQETLATRLADIRFAICPA